MCMSKYPVGTPLNFVYFQHWLANLTHMEYTVGLLEFEAYLSQLPETNA